MLQNAYFLAKICADTAENEQQFAEILPIGRRVADRRPLEENALEDLGLDLNFTTFLQLTGGGSGSDGPAAAFPEDEADLPPSAYFCNFCKFLAGSFSAVSKRNFARKYAFDSIFQALQDLRTFAPLQSQNFRKKLV